MDDFDSILSALKDGDSYYGSNLIEIYPITEAPQGKIWDIVLIKAGLSKNGNYYSEEVLKDAVKLFEGVKVYAYEFKGNQYLHLPPKARQMLPGGFAKNLVGWVEDVRYDDDQKALVGKFHCAADWFRELLVNSWGKRDDLIGFSVDIQGYVEKGIIEGQKVNIVQKIMKVNELTAVSEPAAGGKVLRLVAGGTTKEGEMKDLIKKLLELLSVKLEGDEPSDEEVTEALKKAISVLEDEGEELNLTEKLTLDDLKDALEKIRDYLKGGKVKAAQKALDKLIPQVVRMGYGYPAPKAEGDAEKKIAELTKKLEEATRQLDEVTLKLKMKEKAEKISELLAESELPEEYISPYFKERLLSMDLDEAKKAIEDRLNLVKSLSGSVKGAGLTEGAKPDDNNTKKEITLDDARKLLGLAK